MNKRSISLIISLLLLLAAILTSVAGCGDGSSTGTSAGNSAPKMAPDFTVKTLTGETVSYSSLKGKPLVLNFAASWCGPCELEAPVLAKMYEKYKDKANFFGSPCVT
jgi:thiol-disulfide isomerase/thioredoxin